MNWAGIAGLWVALLVPSQVWAADAGADKLPRPLPSGTTFLSDALKARQKDDAANPAMLWVEDGAALWARTVGAAGKACANCHGRAPGSMKGVAARYPAIDKTSGQLVNLEGRINLCRTRHQQAEPLASESNALLLGLEVLHSPAIARASPSVSISRAPRCPITSVAKRSFTAGKVSSTCRVRNAMTEKAGRRLRGRRHQLCCARRDIRSIGSNGSPVGSLHRRFRFLLVRACAAVRFPLAVRRNIWRLNSISPNARRGRRSKRLRSGSDMNAL